MGAAAPSPPQCSPGNQTLQGNVLLGGSFEGEVRRERRVTEKAP